MNDSELYCQITALPLLQGISAEDILQMYEKGAMRIISTEPEEGEIIVQGQHCNNLTMLMDGTLFCTTHGDGWTLTEELCAPAILEEEALWSLSQKYSHSYSPKSDGRLLVIDRQHAIHTMMHNDIFRINILTRMSSRLENYNLNAHCPPPQNIAEKIRLFIEKISYTNMWPKTLSIKMTTLADIIDETRLRVSQTLRQMQENGEIISTREQIVFHNITH